VKTIAVCIINYNTSDLLRKCLHSVVAQNPDEIVVVDNASTDGSVEMLKAEFPSIWLLALPRNVGFGSACNRGIETCCAEQVVLLNADTRMNPGSLRALCEYLEEHPQAAIIGPRILNPDGTLQTSCFHFPTPLHIFLYASGLYLWIPRLPILKRRTLQKITSELARPVPWVLGAALAFRRESFDAVHGFDEHFFMYFEEVDLCYRLFLQGKQIHFVPAAEIVHVGGGSTTQNGAWSYIQFFVSLAQFYRKHYSQPLQREMVFIVKGVAFFKLVGGLLLHRMTGDSTQRFTLAMDPEIQRQLFFGQWHRDSNAGTALPE
jgi:GT2 family glycosyltransferase